MKQLKMIFIGLILGTCFALGGCRVSLTAEKLEASWEIDSINYQIVPGDEPKRD